MKAHRLNSRRLWVDIAIILAGVFIATNVRAENTLAFDAKAQINPVGAYTNTAIHEDLSAAKTAEMTPQGEVVAEQSQAQVTLSSHLIEGLNIVGEQITDVYYLEKNRAGKSIITRAFHKYPENISANNHLSVASIYKEEWFGPSLKKISSYYREDARIAEPDDNILRVETIEITEALNEDGTISIIDKRYLHITYKMTPSGLTLVSNDFEYISKDYSTGEETIVENYSRTTIYDKVGEPAELIIKNNDQIVLDLVFFQDPHAEKIDSSQKESILPLVEFARIANRYNQWIKRENAIRLNKPEAGAFPKLSVTMKQVKHLA